MTATDQNSIAYHAGEFKTLRDCNVNISTHALQYGTMVFGGLRGYYNAAHDNLYIFRIDDHYNRLVKSARIMQMNPPKTAAEMKSITLELARKNNFRTNTYFRPFIYKSDLQLSPRLHDIHDAFALYTVPLNDYLDTTRGMRTAVSSWRRIDENIIPTRAKASGGYINSALAKSEAVQNGFDEAIFLDMRGMVSEGSAENIFIVRENTIITPHLASAVLEGITRRSIIELARSMGYSVVERDVARAELYICDEAFFCGTGAQVAWIAEIDRRVIGDGNIGPISSKLRDRFVNIVNGEDPEFKHWLTAVY
ncbi:MAG: branched-chain amino acid transaminase [Leptospiraceae bacterium]|nr:branched-chain amino acid transaminase [Leptospiraceae bacterium]